MEWPRIVAIILLLIVPVIYWRKDASLGLGRPSVALFVTMFFAPWWYLIWYNGTYRKQRDQLDAIAASQYRPASWVESERARS